MKAKTTMILQTIGMYVMHMPLYVLLIITFLPMDAELQESLTKALLIAALVQMILMIPVCILNAAVSLLSVIKRDVDPTKTTMVIKLSLIPWYALNFLIGFVFVSIFFNPFMMIAIPIIVALLASSTYVLMLSTSLGDIAYVVYNHFKKDRPADFTTKLSVLFLFVFCLDVLGAIILYKKSKNISAQTTASAEQH